MKELQYIWLYEFYALFLILGGLIWLFKKRWEVHHWEVGFVVCMISIPLLFFVLITNDLLGYFFISNIYFLGIVAIIMDYKDVKIFLEGVYYLLFKTKW